MKKRRRVAPCRLPTSPSMSQGIAWTVRWVKKFMFIKRLTRCALKCPFPQHRHQVRALRNGSDLSPCPRGRFLTQSRDDRWPRHHPQFPQRAPTRTAPHQRASAAILPPPPGHPESDPPHPGPQPAKPDSAAVVRRTTRNPARPESPSAAAPCHSAANRPPLRTSNPDPRGRQPSLIYRQSARRSPCRALTKAPRPRLMRPHPRPHPTARTCPRRSIDGPAHLLPVTTRERVARTRTRPIKPYKTPTPLKRSAALPGTRGDHRLTLQLRRFQCIANQFETPNQRPRRCLARIRSDRIADNQGRASSSLARCRRESHPYKQKWVVPPGGRFMFHRFVSGWADTHPAAPPIVAPRHACCDRTETAPGPRVD